MVKKRAPLAEKKKLVGEILAMKSKGVTIGEACEKLGVQRHNFMAWRKKFGDSEVPAVRGAARPGDLASFRVSGSTDVMFVGFGKSKDILQALDSLSTIFKGRMNAH